MLLDNLPGVAPGVPQLPAGPRSSETVLRFDCFKQPINN